MFHKVKNVSYTPDYMLYVHFSEGVTKEYDIRLLFERIPAFRAVQDNTKLLDKVSVDTGGYGIVWNDDVDLSCDELWENGTVVKTKFDGLMALSDATIIWGLNESTLRKAISYGKLRYGIDVCKFGKQWVISTEAMRREYGEP